MFTSKSVFIRVLVLLTVLANCALIAFVIVKSHLIHLSCETDELLVGKGSHYLSFDLADPLQPDHR